MGTMDKVQEGIKVSDGRLMKSFLFSFVFYSTCLLRGSN